MYRFNIIIMTEKAINLVKTSGNLSAHPAP